MFPDERIDSIFDLDFDKLRSKGIKYLIFDIDNTLAPYDCPGCEKDVEIFLRRAASDGFAVGFISNNKAARVEKFNEVFKYEAAARARKPFKKGLYRLLTKMGAHKSQVCVVGDQLFTDVWMARSAGIYSVLVKPLCGRDERGVWIKRVFERIILMFYRDQRE